MELRHLRYFVAVEETLSFTRAAESLYISQSTLSQQIADLEQELGTKLLDRNRRRVALTGSGRALLVESHRILAQVAGLSEGIQDTSALRKVPRQFRVGFDMRVLGSDLLKHAITSRVYELRENLPDLRVEFTSGEYDATVQELRAGHTDLAFFLHQHPSVEAGGALMSRCLYQDEIVAVVRSHSRIEDTRDNLFLELDRRGVTLLEGEGRGILQAVRVFEDLGIEPPIHFVPNREAMLLSVNSGERAALLPKGLVARLVEPDAQVLRFHVPSAALYVLAAWAPDNPTPLITEVVNAVVQTLQPWVDLREKELATEASETRR